MSLTGTEKSAILMMTIGEERAAEVFKHLNQREVQPVSYTHLTLPTICSV